MTIDLDFESCVQGVNRFLKSNKVYFVYFLTKVLYSEYKSMDFDKMEFSEMRVQIISNGRRL